MIHLGDINNIDLNDIKQINGKDKDNIIINKSMKKEITPFNDTETIEETNPMIQVINNLDSDIIQDNNLTSIDFNTRLSSSEIGAITALQMLNTLNVGGDSCSLIARSIKRHKVSLDGLGRKEKVEIMRGEREHEEDKNKSSLFGKIQGFMGGGKNE